MKLGVGSVVITPPLDTPLAGYYYPRRPAGVHDDLYAKALVFDNGTERVVLVACDALKLPPEAVRNARSRIQRELGIHADHVLIGATHTHTGPVATPEYTRRLESWIFESVSAALHRKRHADLFVGSHAEPSLAHNRRYRMKNGAIETNPGFLNPGIIEPAGPIDPRVGVLFAKGAEGCPLMTWVNYAMHQDTVGGNWISADYSYYLCQSLARRLEPAMLTIFTPGAAGDINHWDVTQPGPQRGFATAEKIGSVLGESVLKALDHVESVSPVPPAPIGAISEVIDLPVRKPGPSELAAAGALLATPPPPDVDFTLDRVNATRIMRAAERNGNDMPAEVQVLAIGSVAIAGIPGEPFVELGLKIAQESPFAHTFVVECANDYIGYLPTERAYREGGYEQASSICEPGSGERVAAKAVALLKRLKDQQSPARKSTIE